MHVGWNTYREVGLPENSSRPLRILTVWVIKWENQKESDCWSGCGDWARLYQNYGECSPLALLMLVPPRRSARGLYPLTGFAGLHDGYICSFIANTHAIYVLFTSPANANLCIEAEFKFILFYVDQSSFLSCRWVTPSWLVSDYHMLQNNSCAMDDGWHIYSAAPCAEEIHELRLTLIFSSLQDHD